MQFVSGILDCAASYGQLNIVLKNYFYLIELCASKKTKETQKK